MVVVSVKIVCDCLYHSPVKTHTAKINVKVLITVVVK